jgi:TPR repeat protein
MGGLLRFTSHDALQRQATMGKKSKKKVSKLANAEDEGAPPAAKERPAVSSPFRDRKASVAALVDGAKQCRLGLLYLNGQGVRLDRKHAITLLLKAAGNGNAESSLILGDCYRQGLGVAKDSRQAVVWYLQAATENNADAQFTLSVCYKDGNGVQEDLENSTKWLKTAAENGHVDAMSSLGQRFRDGTLGCELDSARAVFWFAAAAEKGHADAQHNLSLCLRSGNGVDIDDERGMHWLRQAADQGQQQSVKLLAMLDLVAARKASKAALLLNSYVSLVGLQKRPELNGQFGKVCQFQNESGRYTVKLDNGKSVLLLKKNLGLVCRLYLKSSDGRPPAVEGLHSCQVHCCIVCKTALCIMVAIIHLLFHFCLQALWKSLNGGNSISISNNNTNDSYYDSYSSEEYSDKPPSSIKEINLDRDTGRDALWTRACLAADTGDAALKLALARIYLSGGGCGEQNTDEQNLEQGNIWLQKSAAQGNADAQFMLGKHCAEVEKDPLKAAGFYREAALAGHANAMTAISCYYEVWYEEGLGDEEDLVQAKSFWQQAAENGCEFAAKHLTRLAPLELAARELAACKENLAGEEDHAHKIAEELVEGENASKLANNKAESVSGHNTGAKKRNLKKQKRKAKKEREANPVADSRFVAQADAAAQAKAQLDVLRQDMQQQHADQQCCARQWEVDQRVLEAKQDYDLWVRAAHAKACLRAQTKAAEKAAEQLLLAAACATPTPTAEPTALLKTEPTTVPSQSPSSMPTAEPTAEPSMPLPATSALSPSPSEAPSSALTFVPMVIPSATTILTAHSATEPLATPTPQPTPSPTALPFDSPSVTSVVAAEAQAAVGNMELNFHGFLHEHVLKTFSGLYASNIQRQPAQDMVIRHIENAVAQIGSWLSLETTGSLGAGLQHPDSNMNLSIIGENIFGSGHSAAVLQLKQLHEQLGRGTGGGASHQWIRSLKLVENKAVPVLKITVGDFGLTEVDICVDGPTHRGLQSCALVKTMLNYHPELRPLVLVLKKLLKENDLNNPYTGGLSSYALVLMVEGLLRVHQLDSVHGSHGANLGALYAAFLQVRVNLVATELCVLISCSSCDSYMATTSTQQPTEFRWIVQGS